MGTNRGTQVNTHRDGWVEINLGHLEHNILQIRKVVGETKIMAVVKADAYGHGAFMCAKTLLACGVHALGVASIDEGIELRQNKINAPILVLGAVPIWAFESALKNNIIISIFNEQHLEVAKQLYEKNGSKIRAHIKVDTGMNRIGISSDKAKDFIERAQMAPYLNLEGVFTHFADAEDKNIFEKQSKKFETLVKSIDTKGLTIHASNSGVSLKDASQKYDMQRIGIILYGLTPFAKEDKDFHDLKQVIGLKGRITNLHCVKKGEGISYGHTYSAKEDILVGTIPIGYADGVARSLSGKLIGELNGKQIRQVGRITMDQMMFEIDDANTQVGDIITLLGENLSIDEWASTLNTINYELTCRLKVRLPRIYTR